MFGAGPLGERGAGPESGGPERPEARSGGVGPDGGLTPVVLKVPSEGHGNPRLFEGLKVAPRQIAIGRNAEEQGQADGENQGRGIVQQARPKEQADAGNGQLYPWLETQSEARDPPGFLVVGPRQGPDLPDVNAFEGHVFWNS